MTTIHIFLPKKRRNDCNKRLWKFNHHKRPQYLMSEINNAIRRSDSEDKGVLEVLWRDKFHMKYNFGKR